MFLKVLTAILIATAIFYRAIADTPNEPEARAASYNGNAKYWDEDDIKDNYNVDDLPELAFALNKIYKDDHTLSSFKKMVQLQLYLYQTFTDNMDVNDEYVFNVAYYLSQIKNHGYYSRLSSSTKNSIDTYVEDLPLSARNLFFEPSFCLMNYKYDSKYLYASNLEIANKRNYAFVHTADDFNQNGKSEWKTAVTDASNGYRTQLTFKLQSVRAKHYAYIETNRYGGKRNLAEIWGSNGKPSNAEWTITLHENQLIFSQYGRVICASDSLQDDSRRYVYGVDEDAEDVKDLPECQWFAKECP